MKEFIPLVFDVATCRKELAEFRALLASAQQLDERKDILPFFRRSMHLSAFIGSYFPYFSAFDRVAYEYELFGDFAADLVITNSLKQGVCFVEFENARTDSIFVTKKGKATPEWSPRFEHGFSQLVDWFWRLDDARGSADFTHRFGKPNPKFMGMLVIGRDADMAHREQQRFAWRLDRVVIDSKQIFCVTYDQLAADLADRLQVQQLAASG